MQRGGPLRSLERIARQRAMQAARHAPPRKAQYLPRWRRRCRLRFRILLRLSLVQARRPPRPPRSTFPRSTIESRYGWGLYRAGRVAVQYSPRARYERAADNRIAIGP